MAKKKRHIRKGLLRTIAVLLCAILVCIGILLRSRITEEKEPDPTPESTPETILITPTPIPLPETTSTFSFPYTVKSYAPIQEDTEAGFTTSWGALANEGYITPRIINYDEVQIDCGGPGVGLESAFYYRDGVPFIQGTSITVYFTASADINRNIRVAAVIADENALYTEEAFAITTEPQSYSMTFDIGSDTIWNGRIAFQVGYDGPHTEPGNTVTLKNIRITTTNEDRSIKVNQVGYLTGMQKRCVFPYHAGDAFDVINAETGEVVWSGPLVYGRQDTATGEENYYGEFTNVTTPGTYYIRSQIGTLSYPFVISDDPYSRLDDSLLRMLSLQRCGMNLDDWWAGSMAHAQCHAEQANVYETEIIMDVSGGWHDAGDYGRYVKTGAKAVSDLLWAYQMNPGFFTDAAGTPDSGNGVADILDEARYELEWMLKMQSDSGGVYAKVMTAGFADFILPETDTKPLYILDIDSSSTGSFAGTMALAAMTWKELDPDFSETCLNAAIRADEWLDKNPDNRIVPNPEAVQGGGYLDDDDSEVRFYAKAALYAATSDTKYLNRAKKILADHGGAASGLSWETQGAYGKFILLGCESLKEDDSSFRQNMLKSLQSEADSALHTTELNSFNTSITAYNWGSNGDIAENGIILAMAYRMTGEQKYQQAAVEQLNYLLGKNSINMCFVSGFGTNWPHNTHSRIAVANGTELHGALVGGPDSLRDDPMTQQMPWDTPDAKIYLDMLESFSSNEIAVYWNSAAIALLSAMY